LEEEVCGPETDSPVSEKKSDEDYSVVGANIKPSINMVLNKIEKADQRYPQIEPYLKEDSELEKVVAVNQDSKPGSLDSFQILELAILNETEVEPDKNLLESEESFGTKIKLCQNIKRSHDKNASIIRAGTVKLLQAKYELKQSISTTSSIISHITGHGTELVNDQTIEDVLLQEDDSAIINAEGICQNYAVNHHKKAQIGPENSLSKCVPVFHSPNCNEQGVNQNTCSCITVQKNFLIEDERTHNIKLEEEQGNKKIVLKSPSEVEQFCRSPHTPIHKTNIEGINQINENPGGSTCTSTNKSEIVEINQIYESLKGIQTRWGDEVSSRTHIVETKRDHQLEENDIADHTEREDRRDDEEFFEEDNEGIETRSIRVMMLDGRQPKKDINQMKNDKCERFAVEKAAQEAADDVRPKHKVILPTITRGGEVQSETTAQAHSISNKPILESWSCDVCTYINLTGDLCEICLIGTRQKKVVFKPKSRGFHIKKSMATSMRRLWWRKRGNRKK